MPELLTAAAVLLAWFVFRYERDGRARDAIESAYATLDAVDHAMNRGLTFRAVHHQGQLPQQTTGWGQLYFHADYSDDEARERAKGTRDSVLKRGFDQIFVVPPEPLAKLVTAAPQEGLIDASTVAVASFALWHVHVFNQHAQQLTDFNTAHVVEITSEATTAERLAELAEAAGSLSFTLHRWGIGWAWSAFPGGGGRGWYGALVEALGLNLNRLRAKRALGPRQRLWEWPYSAIDGLVLAGFVAAAIYVVC
jgi:hypothetical protein